MAELKTKPNNQSVTAFLQGIESETRRADAMILLDMFTRISGARALMWGDSIVGFGQYSYTNSAGTYRWMLTGFSPRARNFTLYIMPGFSQLESFLAKLGKHKHAKSCLYINKLTDVDLDVLEKLISASIDDMKSRYECSLKVDLEG